MPLARFPGWVIGTEVFKNFFTRYIVSQVTIKDLLESGVHFGHQTRRWNPKMKKFIFTERNGIYIIDLQKTLANLQKAADATREVSARGESILFVGTKPQAATIVKEEAQRSGQFFITNRWLGGMLTNFRTIRQSVKRLDHLDKMATDGSYEHLTKKEVLTLEKQRERLNSVLEGIRTMNRLPGLLIVVDTKKEKIAVSEAERLGIPVCAILDTNCDPDPITYPIPGNDDAIRSIKLILSSVTDSIIEGVQLRVDQDTLASKEEGADQEDEPQNRRKGRSGSEEESSVDEPSGRETETEEDKKRARRKKEREDAEKKTSDKTSRPAATRPRPAKRKEDDGRSKTPIK